MKQPLATHAALAPTRAQPSTYPQVFAARLSGRVKQPFGLVNFGVNLTGLPPGAMSALRHAHALRDEFIYVLEGRPVLVTNGGETPLVFGLCAGFCAGTGDAHPLINRAVVDAVYLGIGGRSTGDRVTYPDDDLQAECTINDRRVFAYKDGSPF